MNKNIEIEAEYHRQIFQVLLAEHGGFTFNLSTKSFVVPGTTSAGYAVSLPGFEEKHLLSGPAHWADSSVGNKCAEYYKKYGCLVDWKAGTSPACFGAWYDEQSETLYLDISVLVSTYDAAARLAIANGQKSFYDFEKKQVVWVRDAVTNEVLPEFGKHYSLRPGNASATRSSRDERFQKPNRKAAAASRGA